MLIKMSAVSIDSCSNLSYIVYFLQKAHVQQFVATEDALNKASEARNMSQQLLKRLHGTVDAVSSHSLTIGATSQNMSSLRQLEVECCCIALSKSS